MGGSDDDGPVKLLFIDVNKAHLNGEVTEGEYEYIALPNEAGGGVGRLKRWLYGMRPAASAWEDDYTAMMKEAGFDRGRAAPTAYFNRETGVRVAVWGDDSTFLGRERHLREMAKRMAQWYDIKVSAVMAPNHEGDKEVRILHRVVKWLPNELTYQADEKHGMRIMEARHHLRCTMMKSARRTRC